MKILVVDDEADVQVLFRQRFRREIRNGELNLMFATNGLDAMDVLFNSGQEIRLVLSDINMPGMSGLDLLKNIKTAEIAQTPDVIMITAYGDDENRLLCKNLGAENLLSKPLDFGALKELIAEKNT